MRDKTPHFFRAFVATALGQFADEFLHQQISREITFRPRPLEGEFCAHLFPAGAFAADQHAVGHEHIDEDNLVEMRIARQVHDRADGDAR